LRAYIVNLLKVGRKLDKIIGGTSDGLTYVQGT
jgi:hypothetical protein